MASLKSFHHHALPGRVVFGPGCSGTALADEIASLQVERLLVVTTSRATPLAGTLVAPLGDTVAGTYTGVRPHVPDDVVTAVRAAARDAGADGLLAVGGGSAIGAAKSVALETPMPVVAIPTTYSGSEMTPVWGMTREGEKRTGRSADVLPAVVLYDPELTMTLPASVTVTSGMNAVAHCVEACYATGASPVTALLAAEGAGILADHLPRAAEHGADVRARTEVQYGAYLAGSAFAVAGSDLHHKICHVLGGAYDLPHAATHTVMLPHVTALVEAHDPTSLYRLADAIGADTAAHGVADLARRLGAPNSLRALGMEDDDIPKAASLLAERIDVATPVDERSLHQLLAAALVGPPPL